MVLIAVYIGKSGELEIGEIEQGRFIEVENMKSIFKSNENTAIDKFMATHRKNYKRDTNLTSLDPNVLSIWVPG